MKKIVMLVVMLLTFAFSAVCSAASGKVLDAEEAIAAKFMEGNYKAVSAMMSADMQKTFTQEAYTNFHSQLTSCALLKNLTTLMCLPTKSLPKRYRLHALCSFLCSMARSPCSMTCV